jgi:hypothetical protein
MPCNMYSIDHFSCIINRSLYSVMYNMERYCTRQYCIENLVQYVFYHYLIMPCNMSLVTSKLSHDVYYKSHDVQCGSHDIQYESHVVLNGCILNVCEQFIIDLLYIPGLILKLYIFALFFIRNTSLMMV